MTLFQQIERIRYIHRLIRTESTGCPDRLAGRVHLSRRQLYNILEEIKDMGADIKYSRSRETFYYANPFVFQIEIEIKILPDAELAKYYAGSRIFLLPCKETARSTFTFVM